MKPTKQAKPVKAWAYLVNGKHLVCQRTFQTKEAAAYHHPLIMDDSENGPSVKIVRVEIRVIGGKK